jgi:two-component system, LytTR family, sensor kinase
MSHPVRSDALTLPPDRARLSWLVIVAAWTVPAALSPFETVMFARGSDHPITVARAFAAEAPGWYVWPALTPVVISLGQRFPLDRRRRLGAIGIHVGASLAASLLVATVSAGADALIRPSQAALLTLIRGWFLSGLPATTLAYFAILGISYALFSAARLRARERHADQLAAQLTDARLSALRMQLQPHFLFNSLNAIMALVRDQDTPGAIGALSLLSDLLRTSLRADTAHQVPLRDELEFVRRYLAMAQIRFGDRLTFQCAAGEDVLGLLVPTFILQPVVENAVRHGIARSRAPGTIDICASRDGSQLSLIVCDDGKGLPPEWEDGTSEGLGLANTRARLAYMHGSASSLTVKRGRENRGVVATIRLPAVSPTDGAPLPQVAPQPVAAGG